MFVGSFQNLFEFFLKLGCTIVTIFMIYIEILTRYVKAEFFMARIEAGFHPQWQNFGANIFG